MRDLATKVERVVEPAQLEAGQHEPALLVAPRGHARAVGLQRGLAGGAADGSDPR